MNFSTIRFVNGLIGFLVLMISFSGTLMAAPGELADSPLFTTNNTPPNVFFEVDDSGSMDWEILTVRHWRNCAYDRDSYRDTGNSDCGSLRTNGLIQLRPDSDGAENFEYLYNNDDDAYSNNCSSSRETFFMCNSSVQSSDWRIRSSAVNVLYYNPDITYQPWQKGEAEGSVMDNASFTSARSDPQSKNTTGYNDTRSLSGFIYEVWEDTHGFSGDRPRRGTNINRTDGANGLVDLWDKHTRYTVTTTQIVVEEITYAPWADGTLNPTIVTKTLSGTDTLNGKTISEVKQNIANWYQYARRRSFVAKSAIAKVITEKPDFRYGLNFINNNSFPFDGGNTSFVEVPVKASISHNTKLITGMTRLDWPASSTPLRRGLERVGKYFDDDLSGKTDPITEECQRNFAILFTDGYWNGSNPDSDIGDADDDGHDRTVADVAKFYYDKDLSNLPNNVLPSGIDLATHQHMVTYTVAFGLTGLLTDADGDGWPEVAVENDSDGNPKPMESGNWGSPFTSDSPQKIDDLWHAAFNSKGAFISAQTPEDVSQGLTDALGEISDRLGSASSVAFNTTTLSGVSSVFLAQFNSSNNKWSGDILAFPLDPITGNVSENSSWSAADILEARTNPVTSRKIFTYNGTDGVPFLWANLTATQKADLKVNPDNSTSDDTKAQARLNFLRGDRSNDEGNNGSYIFRKRSKLLGDMVHSDPVFVGRPLLFWPNVSPFPIPSTAGSTHDDFKKGSAKTRQEMLYVGANDGMLHGFNASDGSEVMAYIPNSIFDSSSATSGLHYLTDVDYTHRYYVDMPVSVSDVYIPQNDETGTLGSSAWTTILIGGGRGGSRGLFALDITDPTQFVEDTSHAKKLVLWEFDENTDADLGFTYSKPVIAMMNNGKWAAIFGNGYNSTGDGKAKLFIVFIEGGLDGVWTDGSNGSDLDYIKINTDVGSISSSDCLNGSSDCNGLSTPLAIDEDGDKVVDRVYAGDLHGNMWAFDLCDRSLSGKKKCSLSTNNWGVAYQSGTTPKPLFTATHHSTTVTDPPSAPAQVSSTRQPITERPILVRHTEKPDGDPDVLVFFGTGQYLVSGDISNTAVQSFYGVWDNGSGSLTPANLVEQTFLSEIFTNDGSDVSSQIRVLSDNTVDYLGTDKGWFINLTLDSGERVVVDPDVRGDVVFFNTWIPTSNSCDAGGSGILMSVDKFKGGRTETAPFDFNGDGVIDEKDLVSFIDAGGNIVTYSVSGEVFDRGLPASSSFLSNMQYTPGTDPKKDGNDGDGDDGDDDDDDDDCDNNIDCRPVPPLKDSGTGRFSWQELRK